MTVEERFCILAVDDNPLNLKLIQTALSKEGYRIITASNGPDAREIAADEIPDLILLDIRMPGEDGFDVIKQLKNDSITNSIPVIFLSGVSEIDAKLTGFELGAVDYIIKPFHPLEVLARVQLHLKLSIATNSLISTQANKLKQITKVHTSMLTTPEMQPDAHFGVYYLSLQEAGGDFYDVLPISKDIYGYFVADLSGHDISTGFLTSSLKALLRQNCSPIYQPLESIKMINDVLVEILPEDKYLTVCYSRLNRKTNQMTIINAGHPPVAYVPVKGDPRLIEMDGDIIGIFKEVLFGQYTLKVSPGDRFYIYSDGLIESPKERLLWTAGKDKILPACEEFRDVPVTDAPEKIKTCICNGNEELQDDIVVLGIQV